MQSKKKRDICLPSSSKANIVGEDCSIVNSVVAMNCINPIHHRNAKATGQRPPLDIIHHIHPFLRRRLRAWTTPSTAQHTPCIIPYIYVDKRS